MEGDCIFCRIVAKELPAKIVYEDDEMLAFPDVSPRAPLHVLIVPKVHLDSLAEATDAGLIGRLALRAAAIAKEGGYAERGFRVLTNTGPEAGQTVQHLHMHVLAGRLGRRGGTSALW